MKGLSPGTHVEPCWLWRQYRLYEPSGASKPLRLQSCFMTLWTLIFQLFWRTSECKRSVQLCLCGACLRCSAEPRRWLLSEQPRQEQLLTVRNLEQDQAPPAGGWNKTRTNVAWGGTEREERTVQSHVLFMGCCPESVGRNLRGWVGTHEVSGSCGESPALLRSLILLEASWLLQTHPASGKQSPAPSPAATPWFHADSETGFKPQSNFSQSHIQYRFFGF